MEQFILSKNCIISASTSCTIVGTRWLLVFVVLQMPSASAHSARLDLQLFFLTFTTYSGWVEPSGLVRQRIVLQNRVQREDSAHGTPTGRPSKIRGRRAGDTLEHRDENGEREIVELSPDKHQRRRPGTKMPVHAWIGGVRGVGTGGRGREGLQRERPKGAGEGGGQGPGTTKRGHPGRSYSNGPKGERSSEVLFGTSGQKSRETTDGSPGNTKAVPPTPEITKATGSGRVAYRDGTRGGGGKHGRNALQDVPGAPTEGSDV